MVPYIRKKLDDLWETNLKKLCCIFTTAIFYLSFQSQSFCKKLGGPLTDGFLPVTQARTIMDEFLLCVGSNIVDILLHQTAHTTYNLTILFYFQKNYFSWRKPDTSKRRKENNLIQHCVVWRLATLEDRKKRVQAMI